MKLSVLICLLGLVSSIQLKAYLIKDEEAAPAETAEAPKEEGKAAAKEETKKVDDKKEAKDNSKSAVTKAVAPVPEEKPYVPDLTNIGKA